MAVTVHSLNFPPKKLQGYSIQIESVAEISYEILCLWEAQWKEQKRDMEKFNPDLPRVIAAEASGWFFQVTLRKGRKLVGGLGIFIHPDLWTQEYHAEESTFYLNPLHRKGLLASSVCKYTMDVLRYIGVKEIKMTVETQARVGKLLTQLKFLHTHDAYSILVR